MTGAPTPIFSDLGCAAIDDGDFQIAAGADERR